MLRTRPSGSASGTLSIVLERTRRRLRLARVARTTIVVIPVIGIATAIAAVGVSWFAGVSPERVALVGIVSAISWLLVASVWQSVRRVTDAELARVIDRLPAIAGRFSATLEVANRSKHNRVERALLATLPEWAPAVDPRQVVRFPKLRAWVWTAPTWLAVVAAVAWVDVPVASTEVPRPSVTYGAVGVTEVELARKAERMSHLLRRESEASGEASIGRLADAFADIGERLARGELPSAEAWSQINDLGDDVARSLGYADDPEFRVGDGAGDTSAGTGAQPATARDRATPMIDDGRREEPIGVTDAPRDGERVLDSLLERLETDALARAAPDADARLDDVTLRRATDTTDEGLYFDNPSIDTSNQAALQADAARPDRGGAVAGDAGGPGGNEAGGGTQDLDVGAQVGDLLATLDTTREALGLPEREPPGARRLRVYAAPPARGDPGEAGAAIAEIPWTRTSEAFVGGIRVAIADMVAVSAFHEVREEHRRE